MLIVDFIRKFRDRKSVAGDELRAFIEGVSDGSIPDYQISAWAMAVFLNGMSAQQRGELTVAMRDSGQVLDWSGVDGVMVDKHSTGGVGDKISIPLAPLVAACGVKVPMVSGRGLGHTGGTLDKLESIPGFRVGVTSEAFRAQVAEIGLCLAGQTAEIAPADKKLYALRDVTATVESIDLIASSIMSKKLAEGIDGLVLDVKVGSGAFMKTEAEARALATALVEIGEHAGVRTTAVLTSMEQPLGRMVGNALEMLESFEVLRGAGPPDTHALTVELGAHMLLLGQAAADLVEGRARIEAAMADGSGVDMLRRVILAQGGEPRVLDEPDLLPRAADVVEFEAPQAGVVSAIDTHLVGMAALVLGAGRERAEDDIDPAVGFEVLAKLGDTVEQGQPLVRAHYNDAARLSRARSMLLSAYTIEAGEDQPSLPLVIATL